MLVIADATRAQAVAGVMGGGRVRSVHASTRDHRDRERLLPALVRAPHVEAPGADRPRRRTASSAAPTSTHRCCALARTCELLESAPARARRAQASIDAYPGRRAATTIPLGGCVRRPHPRPRRRGRGRRAHPRVARLRRRPTTRADEQWTVTGAELAQRRRARRRPVRGDRATPRLRPPAAHVPRRSSRPPPPLEPRLVHERTAKRQRGPRRVQRSR